MLKFLWVLFQVVAIQFYFETIPLQNGVLNPLMWENGDALMADRGFTIRKYTDVLNGELIIPAF